MTFLTGSDKAVTLSAPEFSFGRCGCMVDRTGLFYALNANRGPRTKTDTSRPPSRSFAHVDDSTDLQPGDRVRGHVRTSTQLATRQSGRLRFWTKRSEFG